MSDVETPTTTDNDKPDKPDKDKTHPFGICVPLGECESKHKNDETYA